MSTFTERWTASQQMLISTTLKTATSVRSFSVMLLLKTRTQKLQFQKVDCYIKLNLHIMQFKLQTFWYIDRYQTSVVRLSCIQVLHVLLKMVCWKNNTWQHIADASIKSWQRPFWRSINWNPKQLSAKTQINIFNNKLVNYIQNAYQVFLCSFKSNTDISIVNMTMS